MQKTDNLMGHCRLVVSQVGQEGEPENWQFLLRDRSLSPLEYLMNF